MKKILLIAVIAVILVSILAGCSKTENTNSNANSSENTNSQTNSEIGQQEKSETDQEKGKTDIEESKLIVSNQLSDFDLEFLKLENDQNNKVYSPLSIKYALKMLEAGAEGESKAQIEKLLGNYTPTKYNSGSNLSLVNSMFIRNSYKNRIKSTYEDTLKSKFEADVIFDSFDTPDAINNWVSQKTFGIIKNILSDADITDDTKFTLINALAIDMEWNETFLGMIADSSGMYPHEEGKEFYVDKKLNVDETKFNGKDGYASMSINALINNYDIIKELGESEIRRIVEEAFWKSYENEEDMFFTYYDPAKTEYIDIENTTPELWIDGYLDEYIREISANYHKSHHSTDFYVYSDDEVKAFSKDLKTYDGTTLQYIGIMPVRESLNQFIDSRSAEDINRMINGLKAISSENFKEGVATKIKGSIPKFDFSYKLNLKGDLESIGIKDVFHAESADLRNIAPAEEELYISDAIHMATINFNQNGIKAGAATLFDGAGGGGELFDYCFEVPVEIMDMTFDKPYMFFVIDKETKETWFMGTVYEPCLYANEILYEIYSGI